MFHWRDDRQPLINNLKPIHDYRAVPLLDISFCKRNIRFTNEHENGPKCARCVQIVVERGFELFAGKRQPVGHFRIVARFEFRSIQTEQEFLDPVKGGMGFFEPLERKVQLLAVADRYQKVAEGKGIVTLVEKVAKGKEIALGLRHLLAIDEQMFAMN